MRAFILATMLMAAPAAAADQFDLVCKGQYRVRPNGGLTSRDIRFRLDLVTKSWCRDSCTQVRTIQAVEQGKIVLRHQQEERPRLLSFSEIDRVAGTYRDFSAGGGRSFWDEEGRCEVAPFSGFPTAKF